MRSSAVGIALLISLIAGADSIHIRAAQNAYEKGQAALKQKQYDAAIDFFKETFRIEPTFTDAREALIQADLKAGYRVEAAAAITQLLEIEPADVQCRITLGQMLLEQHQPEKALAQFSEALKSAPNNADTLWGFASAANQTGMRERAADALAKGRKLFPSDTRFKVLSLMAPTHQ